jgi:hypothetical protein
MFPEAVAAGIDEPYELGLEHFQLGGCDISMRRTRSVR